MMTKAIAAARILVGFILFIYGVNRFLNFLPLPPGHDPGAKATGVIAGSGLFAPTATAIGVVRILVGLALCAYGANGFLHFLPLSLSKHRPQDGMADLPPRGISP